MSEKDCIDRTGDHPITYRSLVKDLRKLGIEPGICLLVHSSLSSLGWVCGGAVAVIQALEEVLGPQGTLVMPSHSGDLSDPEAWENPPVPQSWWQPIRDTMPCFEADTTPSRGMGAIAECFRSRRGVVRSNHPHYSFCARGPHSAYICDNHGLKGGLGEESPLARLYELDARVLLLGVDHGSNTSLHLSEYRAQYEGKENFVQGAPVCIKGKRKWIRFEDLDIDDEDFPSIGEAFIEETDYCKEGKAGIGRAFYFSQRHMVDFGVSWMEQNR